MFENSIPKLSKDGIYIIEDVSTKDFRKYQHYFAQKDYRAPRKISAYGMMIGVHGRGRARLFDPLPLIEAV